MYLILIVFNFFTQNLPPVVKKRVKALKKLLVAQTDIDTKFYTELHLLECKYHKQYVEFYNKVKYIKYVIIITFLFHLYLFNLQRNDIVQGNYEPTEEECDFPSDDDDDDVKDLSTDMEGKVKLQDPKSLVYFMFYKSIIFISSYYFYIKQSNTASS